MKSNTLGCDTETMTNRIRGTLEHGKHTLTDMGHTMAEKSKEFASMTDECVHRNAWTAILASVGIGFLMGMLISPR